MDHNDTRQDATQDDPVWTVNEVAKFVRSNDETVRRAIRSGHLDAFRYQTDSSRGGNYRVRRSSVYKWLGMPESGVA